MITEEQLQVWSEFYYAVRHDSQGLDWRVVYSESEALYKAMVYRADGETVCTGCTDEEANFIVASFYAMPLLLQELRRLQLALDVATEERDDALSRVRWLESAVSKSETTRLLITLTQSVQVMSDGEIKVIDADGYRAAWVESAGYAAFDSGKVYAGENHGEVESE